MKQLNIPKHSFHGRKIKRKKDKNKTKYMTFSSTET